MTTTPDCPADTVQQLHDAGQHESAIEFASRAIASFEQRAVEDPTLWGSDFPYWELLYWRARSRATVGDHAGALLDLDVIDENYVTIRSLGDDHVPQSILRATILLETGQRDRAFAACRQTIIDEGHSLLGEQATSLVLRFGLFEHSDPAGLALLDLGRSIPSSVEEHEMELWALSCLFRAYFLIEDGAFQASLQWINLPYYDFTYTGRSLEGPLGRAIDALARELVMNTDRILDSREYMEMLNDPMAYHLCAAMNEASELSIYMYSSAAQEVPKRSGAQVNPALLWPGARGRGAEESAVPDVEQFGPDFLAGLVAEVMAAGNNWLYPKEVEGASPPSVRGLSAWLHSTRWSYTQRTFNLEQRLVRSGLLLAHQYLVDRLAERFPREDYTNEWLIRFLMAFEAMYEGGLDADWMERNIRVYLHPKVMDDLSSMLWRVGVTREVYTQVQAISGELSFERLRAAVPGLVTYWLQTLPLVTMLRDMDDTHDSTPNLNPPLDIHRAVQENTGFTHEEMGHLRGLPVEEVEWIFTQAIDRNTFGHASRPQEELRQATPEAGRKIQETCRSLVRLLILTAGVRDSTRRLIKQMYGTSNSMRIRRWSDHASLIKAFCEMAILSAARRGRTLDELNKEMRSILMWADSYRPVGGDPIPPLTWDDYLAKSNNPS